MKLRNLIVITFAAVLLQSCDKDADTTPDPVAIPKPNIEGNYDPPLSNSDLAILESLSDAKISLNDIILDNDQSVQQFLLQYDPTFLQNYPSRKSINTIYTPEMQRMLFISRIFGIASFLMSDENHHHSEGTNKDIEPDQTYLVYSYGSKDYDVRQLPPARTECDDKKVYGLDCSGLLYEETTRAGLPEIVPKKDFSVAAVNDTAKWNAAFRKSNEYKNLIADDLGKIPLDSMRNGDIIIWPTAPHIGIVKNKSIIQIFGSDKRPGCERNYSPSNKPRALTLQNNWDKFGGGNYKIFRVRSNYGYYNITIDGKEHKEIIKAEPIMWKLNTTSYFGFSTLGLDNNLKVYLQLPTYNGVGNYTLKYGSIYNKNSYLQLQDNRVGTTQSTYISWRYSTTDAGKVSITNAELRNGSLVLLEGTFDCYVTLDVVPYNVSKHVTGKFYIAKP